MTPLLIFLIAVVINILRIISPKVSYNVTVIGDSSTLKFLHTTSPQVASLLSHLYYKLLSSFKTVSHTQHLNCSLLYSKEMSFSSSWNSSIRSIISLGLALSQVLTLILIFVTVSASCFIDILLIRNKLWYDYTITFINILYFSSHNLLLHTYHLPTFLLHQDRHQHLPYTLLG